MFFLADPIFLVFASYSIQKTKVAPPAQVRLGGSQLTDLNTVQKWLSFT